MKAEEKAEINRFLLKKGIITGLNPKVEINTVGSKNYDLADLIQEVIESLSKAPEKEEENYFKCKFLFKKSYPQGGTPNWENEVKIFTAKNESELDDKIEAYKSDDHCGYHKYIRLEDVIKM